jgi:hypothetical protein
MLFLKAFLAQLARWGVFVNIFALIINIIWVMLKNLVIQKHILFNACVNKLLYSIPSETNYLKFKNYKYNKVI